MPDIMAKCSIAHIKVELLGSSVISAAETEHILTRLNKPACAFIVGCTN